MMVIFFYEKVEAERFHTRIAFGFKTRSFSASYWINGHYAGEGHYVKLDEFKAIEQQMKELGWLDEKTCENLSDYNLCDRFECSNCGIVLGEYQEIKVDEDDDTGDECTYEYTPKYCPNCGRKIID